LKTRTPPTAFRKCARDRLEPVLTGGVPDLGLDGLIVDRDKKRLEFDPTVLRVSSRKVPSTRRCTIADSPTPEDPATTILNVLAIVGFGEDTDRVVRAHRKSEPRSYDTLKFVPAVSGRASKRSTVMPSEATNISMKIQSYMVFVA
jgi:hypothetical protein